MSENEFIEWIKKVMEKLKIDILQKDDIISQ